MTSAVTAISGFLSRRVSVISTSKRLTQSVGKSVEEIMFFNENVGPLSGLLQTLDDIDSAKATRALRDKVEDLMNGGDLFLSAAAWLVTAKVG